MTKELIKSEETLPDIAKPETVLAFANTLKQYIVEHNLYTPIKGKNYVNVEGWQFALGSMGINPVVESCELLDRPEEIAYKASVTLYKGDKVISRGFAMCSDKEQLKTQRGSFKRWEDEYAVASMAQTRALGKAARLVIGFLMKAAGYEGTPKEEIPNDDIPTINYPDDTVPERTVNDVEFSQSLDEDAEKNSYTLYGGTPVCKVDSSHGEMAPSKYGNGHYCKICWKNKAK